MWQRLSTTLLIVANFLVPVAILVFATGFFPHKTFIPGKASFEDGGNRGPAPFDKVIFMVVDALRRLLPPFHRHVLVLISLATSSTLMAQVSNSPKGRYGCSPALFSH